VSSHTIYNPETVADACAVLARTPGARVLAGGTDLLVRLKDQTTWPPLVDINGIETLQGVTYDAGMLRIGALTTWAVLTDHPLIAEHAQVLVQATEPVGTLEVRHRGTLGGNLASASPAGDAIPPLMALDAQIEIARGARTHRVAIAEFFLGPGRTVLTADEIIVAVWLPAGPLRRGAFARLNRDTTGGISKVTLALTLRCEEGILRDVRIALGAIAPTVIRARAAEDILCGQQPTETVVEDAGAAAARAAKPISDVHANFELRRDICAELLRTALQKALSD
jgi:CO/xanthine dehydrogenase FAD-binding subunit